MRNLGAENVPQNNDPVHSETIWFFWDETGAHRVGPFKTEKKARYELKRYGHWLDTGEDLEEYVMEPLEKDTEDATT